MGENSAVKLPKWQDDARQRKLAGLKKGGGVGRKGGFGYLHYLRFAVKFAQPFANVVREVVRRYAYGTHEGAVLPKYI